MMRQWAIVGVAGLAVLLVSGAAQAATCASIASGNWNNAATWSCAKIPGAGDTVIITSPYTVNLNGNRSAASLTIDAGGALVDGGKNLTVSGNVVVNGTYDGSGNNGQLIMTGNGSTLSGTGTIKDIGRIQVDANVTIPAGSNLNLTLNSEIRVGVNAAATLTIDGTVTGTAQTNGNRIIRLDNNNASSVVINGGINAPNSFVEIQQGGAVTNNGTVTLQYLDGNGDTNTTWTQGANSSLTLSQPTQGWNGTFNASATGNTVTFNGTAAPFNPATYYNIGGTGVTCPHPAGITVLGASPCGGGGGGGGGGGCNSLLPPMPAGGNAVASGGTTTIGAGTNVNGTVVTGTGNSILSPGSTTAWSSAGTALPAPPSPIPTSTVLTTVGAGGLAAGSYGDVRVTTGTGVFTGGSYFMNELYVAPGATAQLAPGDYYVNKLTVGSSITKTGGTLTLSGNGLVRIFVKTNTKGDAALYGGSSGIWDGSLINVGGNPGNLQILLYETTTYFEIGNNAQLTGFVIQPVYGGGAAGIPAIDVHNNVIITGGLYTAGPLKIKNNVTFNYTPAVASAIGGMSTCGPHHFEIQHADGQGVTCTPSTLTIKACADNAVPCTPYTAGVSGTLSATGAPTVNWGGGTPGFTIASGSSTVTKDIQVTTVGSVTLDATSTPAPTTATTCSWGACTFTSANAAFLVSAPNHVAESASTLTIQAVKAAPGNPLVCVPGMTGAKTVNLKCGYTNPASGTLPVRVAGAALNAGNNPAAACDAGGANVNLTFDASGVATASLQYADVGQMSVSASYTGVAGSMDAGLVMTGSGSFITAPASFSVSGVTAGPIKAGAAFSATVTALNAAGNATPNFGKEAVPEGATLSSVLAMGAGTWANPALGGTATIPGASFVNGAATVSNLTWAEVGAINLNAALTSGSYLASGLTASGSTAASTSFIPDHYTTEIVAGGGVPMACPDGSCPVNTLGASGMVYSGQPFTVKVTAQNLAGATTTNYQGAYAQDVTLSGVGGTGTLSNPLLTAANFAAGVGTTTALPSWSLGAAPTAPANITIHAVGTGVSASAQSSGANESGIKVAQGQLKFSNAYGSEKLPLSLSVRAQYCATVTAGVCDWVASTTDNATQFNSATNLTKTIISGPLTAGDVSVVGAGVVTLASGNKSLQLNAPGKTGVADLCVNAPAYLTCQAGRMTFGVYKGRNEFIYLRESY